MTANTSLVLSNPDFDSIRGSLVQFLQGQARFKDYDFAGSNLSVILDLLAYNSYQDAFLASMVASEMFMDTAQLRESIVSHAKELGYNPRSATSSKATVSVEVIPGDNPGTLILPKGQVFATSIGTRNFTFQTLQPYLIQPTNGRWIVQNVAIYEGFAITDVFTVAQSASKAFYTLSNAMADVSTLSVTVNGEPYAQVTSMLNLDGNSKVFFVQENSQGHHEIYFGEGSIGVTPAYQSIIKASYLVTAGSAGNGATAFTCASSINGYTNIAVTVASVASGGADVEDQESIRTNAPSFYQTRNRAVTAGDYKVLLMSRFPEIEAVNVYGGEELTPPQFGKVFICTSTTNQDAAFTSSAKQSYYQYVKDRSPITIQPVLVDPDEVKLVISTQVYYDYVNYQTSALDIQTAVMNAIQAFGAGLSAFNSTFAYSQLTTDIDTAAPAILSNDTSVLMGIDLDAALVQTEAQKLYFRNALTSKTQAISSSLFTYNNKTCQITDDSIGNLRIVSGTQILAKIGTIDYANGIVTINPFVPTLISGELMIFAQSAAKNIDASQNMLLAVDTTKLSINVVPTKP